MNKTISSFIIILTAIAGSALSCSGGAMAGTEPVTQSGAGHINASQPIKDHIDAQVREYLGLPATMVFDGSIYSLSWSSHPSPNFYKQEYIISGDETEKYNKMILVDVLMGDQTVKSVVDMKVAELKSQKLANPHVDYTVTQQSGETVLDFIITANKADGKTITIAERNVYRYKRFVTAAGKSGMMLFGISTRAYDAAGEGFITKIKAGRKVLVEEFARMKLPVLTITD